MGLPESKVFSDKAQGETSVPSSDLLDSTDWFTVFTFLSCWIVHRSGVWTLAVLGCMAPGPLEELLLLAVGVDEESFSLCAHSRCTFPEEWNCWASSISNKRSYSGTRFLHFIRYKCSIPLLLSKKKR